MSASEKLSEMLRERLSGMTPDEIAARLGYSRPGRAMKTIRDILKDPRKVLQKGFYDFRFTATEMLEKITEIAGIDPGTARGLIKEINADIHDDQFGYRPWIFVDTPFARRNEPIFALAFMESQRRLGLPKTIKKMERAQQLAELRAVVRVHQEKLKETDGKIPCWGEPHKYVCHVNADDDIVEVTPGGEIIREFRGVIQHDGAILYLH
jgi:hypothetical protein